MTVHDHQSHRMLAQRAPGRYYQFHIVLVPIISKFIRPAIKFLQTHPFHRIKIPITVDTTICSEAASIGIAQTPRALLGLGYMYVSFPTRHLATWDPSNTTLLALPFSSKANRLLLSMVLYKPLVISFGEQTSSNISGNNAQWTNSVWTSFGVHAQKGKLATERIRKILKIIKKTEKKTYPTSVLCFCIIGYTLE